MTLINADTIETQLLKYNSLDDIADFRPKHPAYSLPTKAYSQTIESQIAQAQATIDQWLTPHQIFKQPLKQTWNLNCLTPELLQTDTYHPVHQDQNIQPFNQTYGQTLKLHAWHSPFDVYLPDLADHYLLKVPQTEGIRSTSNYQKQMTSKFDDYFMSLKKVVQQDYYHMYFDVDPYLPGIDLYTHLYQGLPNERPHLSLTSEANEILNFNDVRTQKLYPALQHAGLGSSSQTPGAMETIDTLLYNQITEPLYQKGIQYGFDFQKAIDTRALVAIDGIPMRIGNYLAFQQAMQDPQNDAYHIPHDEVAYHKLLIRHSGLQREIAAELLHEHQNLTIDLPTQKETSYQAHQKLHLAHFTIAPQPIQTYQYRSPALSQPYLYLSNHNASLYARTLLYLNDTQMYQAYCQQQDQRMRQKMWHTQSNQQQTKQTQQSQQQTTYTQTQHTQAEPHDDFSQQGLIHDFEQRMGRSFNTLNIPPEFQSNSHLASFCIRAKIYFISPSMIETNLRSSDYQNPTVRAYWHLVKDALYDKFNQHDDTRYHLDSIQNFLDFDQNQTLKDQIKQYQAQLHRVQRQNQKLQQQNQDLKYDKEHLNDELEETKEALNNADYAASQYEAENSHIKTTLHNHGLDGYANGNIPY